MSNLEGWDDPNASGEDAEAFSATKLVMAQNRKKSKSGGFQSMGLSKEVLNGTLRRGYQIPTPIQRKTIPVILDGKDVVAMARTGSGKTAAFLIPLFQKLIIPSNRYGARALVMSPTRELAVQTLTFAKEIGKYTGLKCATALGGDSFNEQFAAFHKKPDIIIATPGRFVHLCIEMNLSLDNIEYVVFDEADRLFEMGFYEQLKEIIARLPDNRQTVLFSATLPKLLVEFAQAGLSTPTLIRLDTETKVSELLTQTFFRVNTDDRTALLVHVVTNVIPRHGQTMIFVPTKHHVEFIHALMIELKLKSTFLFSTLDPDTRRINAGKFKNGDAEIMIATDIAARGIDIPHLDSVINYNFPSKAKLYVHRVGRVARAGRAGSAYSFVSPDELPYLIDLQLFFNKDIKMVNSDSTEKNQNPDMLLGKTPQFIIDDNADYLAKAIYFNFDLEHLFGSLNNSMIKFNKTREAPSKASIKRLKDDLWGQDVGFHPLLMKGDYAQEEMKRSSLLDTLKNNRPKATIFEVKKIGAKGVTSGATAVHELKRKGQHFIDQHYKRIEQRKDRQVKQQFEKELAEQQRVKLEGSSEDFINEAFNKKDETTKDGFIPYQAADHYAEEGYAVSTAFEKQTAKYTLDLKQDDEKRMRQTTQRWDRVRKKFVTPMETKKIKTESGHWVAASYKKDIYNKWMQTKGKAHVDSDNEDDEESRPKKKIKKSDDSKFTTLNKGERYKKTHPLLAGVESKQKDIINEVHQLDKRLKNRKLQNKKRAFVKRRRNDNATKKKAASKKNK